jgi:deoxyribonuclease-4
MKNELNIGISITLPISRNALFTEHSQQKSKTNNHSNDAENIYQELSDISIIKNFNSLQIMFSKNNLSSDLISNIKNFVKKIKYKYVYVHASYQINIGAEPIPTIDNLYNPGSEIFLSEIKSAVEIGANGIIVHMGKNVKKQHDSDNIYNNMVNFVIQIFNEIKSKKIIKKSKEFMILFETPAGQGGEMCSNIYELVNFIQIFKPTDFYNNIGLCIDTCHIFQAGYDLNNKQEIKKIHKILNPIKEKIKLIHLNDSYYPMGKKVDRHEQIGKGYILTENLIKFILPYKNLPLILETKPPYKNQIYLLKNKS